MDNHSMKKEITWTERAEAIDRLKLSTYGFNDFEKNFLESVRNRIVLTDKQIDCLNSIFHKYSGAPLIPIKDIEYPKNWRSPGYVHPYERQNPHPP